MPDQPTFVPIWLACRCGHWWDDWQPCNVPIDTWIAHVGSLRCPKCGSRKILLRSIPLAERPPDA